MERRESPSTAQAPRRCHYCGRRTGPHYFRCLCRNVHCTACRLPENHKCTFDWAAMAPKLPRVTSDRGYRPI